MRALTWFLVLAAAGLATPGLLAQETQPFGQEPPREDTGTQNPPPQKQSVRPSQPDRDSRRLFQRFAEDSAIIPGGWVEGQLSFEHIDSGSERAHLDGLFAFAVGKTNEAGLKLGFEWLNADSPDPDGSGIDDIDFYFKHRLLNGSSHCALGGLLKLGIADDGEGLGTGKSDLEGFAACRADTTAATFTGNIGARYNGQPDPPLPDSEVSILAGAGVIFPTGNEISVVIEATWESERLDGLGNDARLTIGLQGVATRPGFGFRGAVAFPLTDATPDYQVLLGAVYLY
ncbi:MAG TPA: hypothetical protein VFQ07_16295 [Candidatus Polarisedimenticolia bacterium]|nr:hypothetical protein [Candidatus Polarisedimenticolia bacterium]